MRSSTDAKWIFIHVPKAGGTTLRSLIYQNLDRKRCRYLNSYRMREEVGEIQKESLAEIDCIEGHMGFGLHEVIDANSKYFTLLRDPVDRVYSYYRHFKRAPSGVLKNFVGLEEKGLNFDELKSLKVHELMDREISYELSEGQLRSLAGSGGLPLFLSQKRKLDQSDLDRAIDNIDRHFAAVGILEEFDSSLLFLQEATFLKKVFYTKQNQAQKKEAPSEGERAEIARRIPWDIKLYEWARSKLIARLASERNFTERLETFREGLSKFQAKRMNEKQNRIRMLNEIFDSIGEKERVAIFGAGEHTLRLLQKTNAGNLNICGILDSYKDEEEFQGYPVLKSSRISEVDPDVVIVSSFSFEEAICRHLSEDVGYKKRIVRLYDKDPTSEFWS